MVLLSEGKSIEIRDILEELGIEFAKWLAFEEQYRSRELPPQSADHSGIIHSTALEKAKE